MYLVLLIVYLVLVLYDGKINFSTKKIMKNYPEHPKMEIDSQNPSAVP